MRITLFLFVLGVALPIRADDRTPTRQEELRRLTGTWVMFDMELNGSGVSRTEVKKIVIEGERYTFYHENNRSPEATISVNPAANPRTIDVKQGGKTMLGIYQFKEGRLEICLEQDRKPRPSVFATAGEPGAGSVLYVLKPKTPPAKLDPVEEVYQQEMKKFAGKWGVTEREIGGRPTKDTKEHGLLVEESKLTNLFRGKAKSSMTALRVDPKANPATIDFRTDNGKIWQGIYRITNDKLEICLGNINTGQRPTVFTTKPEVGAGVSYSVYEKEMK